MGRDSRRATVVLGTRNDEYERGLRSAERATQTWGLRVKGHIQKSLRGAFGGLGGVAGLVGVAGFGALARDVLKFNEGLVTLQISARKSRGEMLAFNAELQKTAATTGAQQEQLLAGAQKYTELTGKFDEFAASMDTFAKAQVATGATMESLVGAAAALSSNLGVKPDAMLAALDSLTAQGKSGKIEIRDMAAELPGLTGQFSQFGTVGLQGTIELGAALQVMAKGFGTASETATGMQSLMTAFVKNAGKLKGIGVNVFDKDGKARDFMVVMNELIAKSKGDPRVLQRVLGRQEAVQAIIPFLKEGRAQYEGLVKIGGQGGEIMADFAEKSESAPVKMAKAMASFKAVFNEALMKNLDAIVAAFTSIMKALSWMAAHPEAMAALAVAFKGGGFMGTLAGLAPGIGGTGGGPGVGGAASGGARFLGAAGGMLQGGAVGYALAQTGERLGDGFDSLATAGNTAAGALAGLGGQLGLLGAAIMGIKLAADLFIAGIDDRQRKIAGDTIGQFFLERGRGLGVSGTGDVMLQPGQIPMGGAHGDMVRGNAKSVLSEGIAQGFFKQGTNGLEMDSAKMVAFVDAQKALDDNEKRRSKSIFNQAFGLQKVDPQLHDFAQGGRSTGPATFGAGGLTPQGGTWQEQLFGVGAGGAAPASGGGVAGSVSSGGELLIRILPIDGFDVKAQKKTRRRGR